MQWSMATRAEIEQTIGQLKRAMQIKSGHQRKDVREVQLAFLKGLQLGPCRDCSHLTIEPPSRGPINAIGCDARYDPAELWLYKSALDFPGGVPECPGFEAPQGQEGLEETSPDIGS